MRTPTFVRDATELDTPRLRDSPCPHCGRYGTLVGHDLVRGHNPVDNDRVLRGRRMFCSNRHRRPGCGRTVAVMLANMLRRRIANTDSLSTVWRALVQGHAPSATADAGLTSRSRSRLLAALGHAQHRVRTGLIGFAPPPASTDPRQLAQLWQHLLAVFGDTLDPLADLQLRTGQPILGCPRMTTLRS